MKILLTGATGYIGKRLLPALVEQGHTVVCCVRDPERFAPPKSLRPNIEIVVLDLLKEDTLVNIPQDIDGAFTWFIPCLPKRITKSWKSNLR